MAIKKRKFTKGKRTKATIGLPNHVRAREGDSKRVVEWLKEGLTTAECQRRLTVEGITEQMVHNLVAAAKKIYGHEFAKDKNSVMGLHIKRYDRDINRLATFEPRTEDDWKYRELKTQAYMDMLETMSSKEKLLGFHKRSFTLKINNDISASIVNAHAKFDLNLLTLSEKIELLKLLDEAKITEKEQYMLKPNPNNIKKEVTEDIEYVDLSFKTDNIEYIKNTNIPKLKKKSEQSEGKNLFDIKNMLADALSKKADEEFKRTDTDRITPQDD